jgi:hypothetical protein
MLNAGALLCPGNIVVFRIYSSSTRALVLMVWIFRLRLSVMFISRTSRNQSKYD